MPHALHGGRDDLTWDFGDGSPPRGGAAVSHAFARAGTYRVRARVGDRVELERTVRVEPRELMRAVPADASALLGLSAMEGNLDRTVDFVERLLGPERGPRVLEGTPLSFATELAAQSPGVLDGAEGLAVFALPGFPGLVSCWGVIDDVKALDALVARLEREGARVDARGDGWARVRMGDGEERIAFIDRGYLYLAFGGERPQTAEAQVRRAASAGLTSQAEVDAARRALGGPLVLFLGPTESARGRVQGVVGTARVSERTLELAGRVLAQGPLWSAERAPAASMLARAPRGPIVVVHAAVAPGELAQLLAGEPGSPRRREVALRMKEDGVELEPLLASLSGELAGLLYFDAEGFFAQVLSQGDTAPKVSLRVEAGLNGGAKVDDWVQALIGRADAEPLGTSADGARRYAATVRGTPVELRVGAKKLELTAGAAPHSPAVDLEAALRKKFPGAFEPGHVSVLVDVGQLRRDIFEVENVPQVPPERLQFAQAFAMAMLEQLVTIDHAFLDASPIPQGLDIRGRLVLQGP